MFEAGAECGGIKCDFLVLVSINQWKKVGANDVRCVCLLGYAAIRTLLASGAMSLLGLLSFDTASNGRCCRMMVVSMFPRFAKFVRSFYCGWSRR